MVKNAVLLREVGSIPTRNFFENGSRDRLFFSFFGFFPCYGHFLPNIPQGCHLASRNFALLCFAFDRNLGVFENHFALLCFAFFGVFWILENTDFALLCFALGSRSVL